MGLFSGKRPDDLGVKNGRLKPPPSSPNAVSSQAQDARHAIAPLTYTGAPDLAMEVLVKIIEATPRAHIVSRTRNYIHAEYQTALLGFVDDVEFWFEPNTKTIHVRSASRLGYSDFGVNRARVEDIRRRFTSAGA
jgi:uncharacterized protein (DUF1499 family)